MAKPFNNFEWATNTNYSTGPDAGTPTRVAPSAGEIDNGFVRNTAAVPQHMNWALGEIQEWLEYLAGLESDAEFLSNDFEWTGEHTFSEDITLDGTGVDVNYDTEPTRLKAISLSRGVLLDAGNAAIAGANYLGSTGVQLPSGGGKFLLPIDLVRGASLYQVDVSAFLGGTYNVSVEVHKIVYSLGTGWTRTTLDTESRPGVSGQQDFSMTFSAEENITGRTSFEVIISSDSTAVVQGVFGYWNDPGPRAAAI